MDKDKDKVREIIRGLLKRIGYTVDINDAQLVEAAQAICDLDTEECPACHGSGWDTREISGYSPFNKMGRPCDRCKGKGRIPKVVKLRRLREAEIEKAVNDTELPFGARISINAMPALLGISQRTLDLIRQLNKDKKFEEGVGIKDETDNSD
jgi:hypothetical protein